MRRLNTGEWIGVIIAVFLCGSVFLFTAVFSNEVELGSTGEESDIPEMVVEGEDVLGDSLGEGAAGGTFPEGEVPEGISDEDAAAM